MELGGGNSKDRRAKRRKATATANDDATGINPPAPKAGPISNNDPAPATIREASAWLRYFGIPERFHRFILPIVALVAVLIVLQVASGGIGPPLRWAYLRLPVISDLERLENQINDKKTGLPALTENESKSRLQLEYVMGFRQVNSQSSAVRP